MGEEAPSRKVIIPKGVLESGSNVIEIPESCEDSRVLIAKLQAKLNRPPGYYPPKTNPDNKFERRIGDVVVGLGMPPLSPVKEERGNYRSSLSQYGSPRQPQYESYEPSYFGTDTTHGSQTISGKFDYCPCSTPIPTRAEPATEFPSPRLSPIRIGRDIFAPESSVYRSAYTPPGSPARPAPPTPRSTPSPPRRATSPSPAARRAPTSDRSCSFGDLSDLCDVSRGGRSSLQATPESLRGLSNFVRNPFATPSTPMPEELTNATIAQSLGELENLELDELRNVQEKMRNFQTSRRELVLSVLSLKEAEVSDPSQ